MLIKEMWHLYGKDKPIFLITLTILIVIIVIPLAINELSKHGVVYVTKWDAADVLSYYASFLPG